MQEIMPSLGGPTQQMVMIYCLLITQTKQCRRAGTTCSRVMQTISGNGRIIVQGLDGRIGYCVFIIREIWARSCQNNRNLLFIATPSVYHCYGGMNIFSCRWVNIVMGLAHFFLRLSVQQGVDNSILKMEENRRI